MTFFKSQAALINIVRLFFWTNLPKVKSWSANSSNIVCALRHYSRSVFLELTLLIKFWITSYLFWFKISYIYFSSGVIFSRSLWSSSSEWSPSSVLSSLSKSDENLSLYMEAAVINLTYKSSINNCAKEWCCKFFNNLSNKEPFCWIRM